MSTAIAPSPVPTRIGVISDTHGLLRPEAVAALAGSELIIHAGDIGSPDIIESLEDLCPVLAIRGNVDRASWADDFPETLELELMSKRVHVLHDRQALDFSPRDRKIDLVISGHSHAPKLETIDGVTYLNPGSAGRRRFRLPVTLATLTFVERELNVKIVTLLPTA